MTSTMQNLKNFIRHGKAAVKNNPQADTPTTHVSPVHAHQQQARNYAPAENDSNTMSHEVQHKANREDLQRIVAEENESRSKLPNYPGLERWTLMEKMGDGAFSNVYRARDKEDKMDLDVAIKVVRKFEMNSSQRANILKEVQIMRGLDHPNIIKLIDFHESKQYYFIILELAPGGELFHQIVKLTYFSEDLARHVITQVAEALRYLHEERGVVHRDIKPENILYRRIPIVPRETPLPKSVDDEDKVDEGEFVPGVGAGGIGQIKIADFGLSKVVWDTQTMTPCGTVGYTAPEIVKDERYSKSVDMWALGCVLYTLLCGFPPFYDESIQVLTEKVAAGQYVFLSPWWDEISKSAQDLVSHLLTVDPEKRYDIKEFLAHPWIRKSQEPTIAARDAPPLATPARERNRQLGGDNPQSFNPDLLETPGAKRRDFRSPGAVNLREIFDVGYAVHRQEEESKRRKNFKQGYNALNTMDEDEYDEGDANEPSKVSRSSDMDMAGVEQSLRKANLNAAANARQAAAPRQAAPPRQQQAQKGYGQHSPAVAAAAREVRRAKAPFELSLDGATLLSRRDKNKRSSNLKMVSTAADS